jgi:hypothetical protein
LEIKGKKGGEREQLKAETKEKTKTLKQTGPPPSLSRLVLILFSRPSTIHSIIAQRLNKPQDEEED